MINEIKIRNLNFVMRKHGEPDQQVDNAVRTKVAKVVLVVVGVNTTAVIVPGW